MRAVGYLVGAGSMSLGVEDAGFALERPWETSGYSRNARSWDLNRHQHRHLVVELSGHNEFPGADDSVDLVYGNPPCGGLSSMTGSQAGSKTNRHMVDWLRMVVARRPRAVLMENAANLATASGGPVREALGRLLDDAGYSHCLWQFWSWQLGTPQKRRRSFLVAARDVKMSAAFVDPGFALEPPPEARVRHHLADLEEREPEPNTSHYWDEAGLKMQVLVAEHWPKCERLYLRSVRYGVLKGTDDLAWLPENLRRRWVSVLPLSVGTGDEPGPAVTSGFMLVHYKRRRLLTMLELQRLTGYPDSWRFTSLHPKWCAQGVPRWNAEWAARRVGELIA